MDQLLLIFISVLIQVAVKEIVTDPKDKVHLTHKQVQA